ncbi:MAG: FG-GAP repeat protein [Spirochaetales bacterium]|nr:FG-GAP repeat protein [Spirochaetales bacterium]
MGKISLFILVFGVLCALCVFLIVNCDMFEDIPMKGDINLLTVQYEWVQVAKLTVNDLEEDDHFGTSVAISGNYIIVGAPDEDTYTGAVYVFDKTISTWKDDVPQRISGQAIGDLFGESVSISGDYMIIGAPFCGKAYIYKRTGTSWGDVEILDAFTSGSFGKSVSIDGSYAVVGAHEYDDTFNNEGVAYFFHRTSDPNNWSMQTQVFTGTPRLNAYMGHSVAISGNYAVCGAWGYENNQLGAGFIYEKNGSNWGVPLPAPFHENWKLNASDAENFDNFGWTVSISGSYMVIGTYSSASAYAFKWNGSNWNQIDILTASEELVIADRFGTAVSISDDLSVVGAYNNTSGRGSAYLYKVINDNFIEEDKIYGDDSVAGDNFGISVAIDGDYAVVGANMCNAERGAVYVFERRLVKK